MELIRELINIDAADGTPVYLQISNAFIRNIKDGKLRKGLKLPGSREVATLLKVNRMTVVAAFNELDAQGWIEILARKGTFVKTTLPILAPENIAGETTQFTLPVKTGFEYDENSIIPVYPTDFPAADKLIFNDGFPDLRIAPIEALVKNMRSFARLHFNKRYLAYGGAQGTYLLRETLAAFLSDTRALPVTPDNILITRGAQMGLYIATSVIVKPGDNIIVGTPGYNAANLTFLQAGAIINPVPIDDNGMCIDEVENICLTKKIKLLYVIPHHHNPTTVTLSPERRIKLLELAAKYKFAIIEDDYDYDFHYASRPLLPMASLDRYGNVIYLGTLTKTLAPVIRVGFVAAPASFIKTCTYLRKTIDMQGDSLMENAIAELYNDGTIARHIKRSVKLYKERRDHFCNLLQTELGGHVSFKIPDGGMAVWTNFLTADLSVVAEKAFKKGLVIKNGKAYDTDKIKYNSVRLGFASLNFAEQEKAVRILKEIVCG
jgi:GntR family transcriptional regulator/MocR family aminotransferase